jgi:hypothetical protein
MEDLLNEIPDNMSVLLIILGLGYLVWMNYKEIEGNNRVKRAFLGVAHWAGLSILGLLLLNTAFYITHQVMPFSDAFYDGTLWYRLSRFAQVVSTRGFAQLFLLLILIAPSIWIWIRVSRLLEQLENNLKNSTS